MKEREIIGLSLVITIKGEKSKKVMARIDTGATKSSIDSALADELQAGPIVGKKLVKSAHGIKIRPVIKAKIRINGKNLNTTFTLADRKHMKYKVLVGNNILRRLGVLIDPTQK